MLAEVSTLFDQRIRDRRMRENRVAPTGLWVYILPHPQGLRPGLLLYHPLRGFGVLTNLDAFALIWSGRAYSKSALGRQTNASSQKEGAINHAPTSVPT